MSESQHTPDIKAEDLDPEVFELYDQYAHGQLNRKAFMQRLMVFATATLSANMIADFLMPNYAKAMQIAPDDKRQKNAYIQYTSAKGGGTLKGLLARPAKGGKNGKNPGVIVVHENRGLNPYIEDVARRLAVENYIALAPDALTPLGGYPGNDEDGKAMQAKRDKDKMLEDFIAAFHHLRTHPECNGSVGVVGFCFGGYISNHMAVRLPDLEAAVPFYGTQPEGNVVSRIQAPLLIHYAEKDQRVNAGWPDYEAALKKYGKQYQAHIYPGVQHGFHNDTTPRYNKAAAELAWQRTLAFFKAHLKA